MSQTSSVLFAVSLLSLTIYLLALGALLAKPRYKGRVRTGCCRVLAACVYLTVAVAGLTGHGSAWLSADVIIFTQVLWWCNAVADACLDRATGGWRELGRLTILARKGEPMSTEESNPLPPVAPVVSDPLLADHVPQHALGAPPPGPPLLDESPVPPASLSEPPVAPKDAPLRDDRVSRAQHWSEGIIALLVLVAIISVIALAVGVGARSSIAALQSQVRDLRVQLGQQHAAQTVLRAQLTGVCSAYGVLLADYSVTSPARKTFPAGPDTYDNEFRGLALAAERAGCTGISVPIFGAPPVAVPAPRVIR